MKLATAQDMRTMDELAVKEHGLTIAGLMEAAGAGVVSAVEEEYGPLKGKSIGVLCGKGNNGGDALVVARLLKQKKLAVNAVVLGEVEKLSSEAQKQYQKLKLVKVPLLHVIDAKSLKTAGDSLGKCDLLVDGLFGTGLTRPVEGLGKDLIELCGKLGKTVVAVDVPSGLPSDTGMPLGAVLPAQLTVTFGLPKMGFYTASGAAMTGKVKVADIGFPEELLKASSIKQELIDLSMVHSALPKYDDNIHKGTRGRLLVVAGATGLTGAATLCAYGAQRIGAGLVTVASPQSLNAILEVKLTEPMTAPVQEIDGGFLSPKAAGRILHLAANVDAVVIGPGIGRHRETGQLVRDLLTKFTVPVVVDADALNLLGGQLDIFKTMRVPVILTPHPGEAAWLLKISVSEVEQNRVKVACQIAQDYNTHVVLKGRYTVIASPQGGVRVNASGNRGLATAGTGDVLAGMIGGLLAQRLSPLDAATAAVHLHGLAGEAASRELGPDGLIAGDLLPLLPQLLREARADNREPQWPSRSNSKISGKRSSSSSKSGSRSSTNT